jgi:hypothetical protein
MGVAARESGRMVWALEHHLSWAEKVKECLEHNSVTSVCLCIAELRSYGDFSWYSPPLDAMPSGFTLVVCDGPPGNTPGGRYGLLPVMASRLGPGCVVLLDDVIREPEARIARRWAEEFGAHYEVRGLKGPFAEVVLP